LQFHVAVTARLSWQWLLHQVTTRSEPAVCCFRDQHSVA
jgi:hypothetical protein